MDIFAHNPKTGKTVAVQVKTALQKIGKSFTAAHPFIVAEANYENLDDVLREKVKSPHIFVYISADKSNMKFFIVPAEDVRSLAKKDFMRWWGKSKHRKPLNELKTKKQPITIALDDLKTYENRWDLLGLGAS